MSIRLQLDKNNTWDVHVSLKELLYNIMMIMMHDNQTIYNNIIIVSIIIISNITIMW